jgi:hypothetical protein
VDNNDGNPKPAYMEAAARLSKLLHVPEERLLDYNTEGRASYPDSTKSVVENAVSLRKTPPSPVYLVLRTHGGQK